MGMNRLYVVATPIGNLEDVSLRALRVLSEVSLVAAEDTRTAGVFLRHHGLHPKLISYTDHNMRGRIPQILQRLAEGDVALVNGRGHARDQRPRRRPRRRPRARPATRCSPCPVPRPLSRRSRSPAWAAPSFASPASCPAAAASCSDLLEDAARRAETLVAFEAPTRLRKSLEAIAEVLPDRRIAVSPRAHQAARRDLRRHGG